MGNTVNKIVKVLQDAKVGKEAQQDPFPILFSKHVPHILESIFISLDYESYKACQEVSITWKSLLTLESVQKKAKPLFYEGILEDEKKLRDASAV